MNIIEKIFDTFGYARKEFSRGIVAISPTAEKQGAMPEVDYETLWRAYQRHPTTRACVDTFVKAAMSTGWSLRANLEKTDPENFKKLMDFFENPNPQESLEELLEDLFKDLMIFGNGYLEIVRDSNKQPLQLWTLDATTMKIKVDNHGTILGFRQEIVGNVQEWEADEVLHFRLSTKGSTPYGLSFIETLSTTIQADIYAEVYNRKFFEQGAKVKKAYRMKSASDAEIKRNRAYLEDLARPENAHKDLLLEGDFEVIDVGVTPKDMEFLELRKFLRDQEFSVFGTPPAMVSIIETAHLGAGTGETQLRLFFKGKIEPLQKRIASKINQFLVKKGFGIEDWRFQFEPRIDMDVLTEARAHSLFIESNILSPEEARTKLGYPPRQVIGEVKSNSLVSEILPEAEENFNSALKKREFGLINKFRNEFIDLIQELDEEIKTKDAEEVIQEERFIERLYPVITQAMNLGQGLARIRADNKQLRYSPQASKQVKSSFRISMRELAHMAKELKDKEKLRDYLGERADILARAEIRKAIQVVVSDICE